MALIRPSAVSAATSRRRRSRWIMVSATVSSSSERLPPTSRWMRMAMTAQAKSGAVHALGDAVERLLERPAEAGLGDHPAQLVAHRLVDLLGDGLDALHQRVAGPQGAGEQLSMSGSWDLNCLRRRPARKLTTATRDQRRQDADDEAER